MLDRYIWGHVDRISPEAPVPVLQWQSTDSRLGGAANVALNINQLGAHASLMGVVGDDKSGTVIRKKLQEKNIDDTLVIGVSGVQTTIKTRILGGHQHLLRIDEEQPLDMQAEEVVQLRDALMSYCKQRKPDAIILQDYNKGFFTPPVIDMIMQSARTFKIPVFVDPKDENFFAFKGATLFKPNFKELAAKMPFAVDHSNTLIQQAAEHLFASLHCELAAITLSEHGIFLSDHQTSGIFPTRAQTVVDVCGAGDAVIAVLALAYLMQASLEQMALLANIAGGVVCEEVGVCPVDVSRMKAEVAKS